MTPYSYIPKDLRGLKISSFLSSSEECKPFPEEKRPPAKRQELLQPRLIWWEFSCGLQHDKY